MAAAIKVISDSQPTGSAIREVIVQVTGDAAYPTGGYPVGAAQGLPVPGTVVFASFEVNPGAVTTQTWTATFDYVNSKVKIARDNGEVANGFNAGALVLRGLIQFKVA